MTAEFADFHEITRRRYEYALGIDTRDWELFRSIFTDQISIDFTSYDGQTAGDMTPEKWMESLKPLFHGLAATQHTMSNPVVDADGNQATMKMYMQADHFLTEDEGDGRYTLGGYYLDRLVKEEGKWLISSVTLNLLWRSGKPEIMPIAFERGQALLA